MKPSLVVYGNCQADWVEQSLRVVPAIADRFDLHYIYSFEHPVTGRARPDPDVLGRCAVLFEQRGAWDRFPWRGALPASTQVVTFPVLTMEALWPLTTFADPRNVPVLPDYPFGVFPYGDRVLAEWVADGVPRDEAARRYLAWSVSEHEDLPRIMAMGEVRLAMADEASDVKMADALPDRVRHEPLFYTCNHPRPAVLALLVDRILGHSGLVNGAAAGASRAVRELLDECRPNAHIQVPIHPDVAAAFGLSWYRDDLAYCCYRLTDLSYADYWHAYAAY